MIVADKPRFRDITHIALIKQNRVELKASKGSLIVTEKWPLGQGAKARAMLQVQDDDEDKSMQ